MRIGIALGSNLGDRCANLKSARARIEQLREIQAPILASSIFETEPIDCEANAQRFLNAVIEIGYTGGPHQLLAQLRQIEAELGRPMQHPRNTSRTLDLDLLYFGDAQIRDEHLELPHPGMLTRRFVLEPLAEIRPDLILPGQTESVSALLARLPEAQLVRTASEW